MNDYSKENARRNILKERRLIEHGIDRPLKTAFLLNVGNMIANLFAHLIQIALIVALMIAGAYAVNHWLA